MMSPVLRACRRNDNAAWTGGITFKVRACENGPPGSGAPPM